MQILMKKKIFFCNFAILLILLGIPNLKAQEKDYQKTIEKADQLFSSQKYLASLKIYQDILSDGESSPRMLLKMAFMSEALEDYPQTLYYLSLHYQLSPDIATLEKLESIALAKCLKGYEHSDFDVITAFYRNYFEYFVSAFILLSITLFIFILWRRGKKGSLPARYGFVFIFLLALFYYLLNFTDTQKQAIISKNNAYLMKAPSAGSVPIDILEKGHRLEVVEARDIWFKVLWQEQEAYVHKDNLWLIRLE